MDGEDTVLPLGTITIQEEKAPEGYLLNTDIFVICANRLNNGTMVEQILDKATIEEQVVRPSFPVKSTSIVNPLVRRRFPFRCT